MDELEQFTEFIYGNQRGYVYAPTLEPSGKWNQKFYEWPKQKREFHDWIKTNSNDPEVRAVYVSPVIYKERRATKDAIHSSQVVWVEFDGQEQIDFTKLGAKPNAIVQTSSSTHLHCYWKVPSQSIKTIEDINLRLTYFLHADASGYDATQLLRPPGSFNRKPEYPQEYPVKLAYLSDGQFAPEAFDKAPVVEKRPPTVELANLKDYKEVLRETQIPLSILRRITKETVPPGARSHFYSKIAYELAEEGLKHAQIVSLLHHVDERVGKFKTRTDRLLRLSQLADFALHKVAAEEAVVTYTLHDILHHTEKLEWILPGWLHETGFMIVTGALGVGKTQFLMQMGTQLVSHHDFLGKSPHKKREERILFWSLEMDKVSLQYIVQHQAKKWTKDLDHSRLFVNDEEMPLMKMENFISERGITILMLDSISEILETGGTDQNEKARAAMRWLKKIRRRYRIAVVAIHHNRKASDGNRKKPSTIDDLYGSFYFGKDTDTVINLWDAGDVIELDGLKTRYDKKGSIGKVVRDEETLWFSKEGEKKDARSESRRSTTLESPRFNF